MKGELSGTIKVAFIYMTTVVGAGFASGQEILQFFSGYRQGGAYGILLAGVLFALIGSIVLDKVYMERIRNYNEFILPALGFFWSRILEVITTLFVLCLFSIMLTGAGSVVAERFGIQLRYGMLMMALICLLILMADIKGVAVLNALAAPILIAGISAVGIYIIAFRDVFVFRGFGESLRMLTQNWFASSLTYVGYNSIMSVMILCSLLPYLKTRRVGIAGGILGGGLLCGIALIMNAAILIASPEIPGELPVMSIVWKYSSAVGGMYTFVLWLAMLVSAVTSGYCFIERAGGRIRVGKKLLAAFLCALSILMSGFGFSGLISAIYPLFGYVGIFMFFLILLQGILKMLRTNNR